MTWQGKTTTGILTSNSRWWEDRQCPGCGYVYAVPKPSNTHQPDKYWICKPCGYDFRQSNLTGHNSTAIIADDSAPSPADKPKPPIDFFAINKEFASR